MTSPVALEPDLRARIGDLLGTIVLGDVLGSGAGGVVLAAEMRATGEPVVVKASLDTTLGSDREAEVIMTCDHPHVVKGLSYHCEAGLRVLVMEHRGGETLWSRKRRRPLSPRRILEVVTAVASALDHVHSRGYLHGDVMAENVLFDESGAHCLVDFGLARPWPHQPEGRVAGTPMFMAPEAIGSGPPLVPATDVYALAMMTYELISDRFPYLHCPDEATILKMQLRAAPLPLRSLVPGIPPGLNDLVMSSLAKDPAERPATAAEFAARLAELETGRAR